MALRSPSTKRSLLAVLIATGTLFAATPAVAVPADKPVAVAPAAAETNDPLLLWFKEQDRLLDDILLRLARIEGLVRDIHRLVAQLPDGLQAIPVAPPAVKPAAVAPPSPAAVPPPAPAAEDGFTPLAALPYALGLAMLALLLLKLKRRRSSAAVDFPLDEVIESVPPASTIRVAPPAAVPAPAPTPAPPHNPPKDDGQAEQALELAEIMLSMGLGHGAAQTLIEQIKQEPKQALRHWLKLLEIYRVNGQRAEFEKSSEELRQHFNVRPEDWLAKPSAQAASLEDYPHISARIGTTWRKPDCLAYVQSLLSDNRGGSRNGFPQAVAEELLLLAGLLKAG